MLEENFDKIIIEGALLLDGFVDNTGLWEKFAELLEELESLPKSMPWNGLSPWQIDMKVHRKLENNVVIPPFEWDRTAITKNRVSAALSFICKDPSNNRLKIDNEFSEFLFEDFARTFTFVANISHPGSFNVLSILTKNHEGIVKEHSGILPRLGGALQYSQKTGWPKLDSVPFADVYRWVYLNGYHVRCGDSPVSRAFNSFTWLFSNNGQENPFSLVSTLIGIEALFCTSSSGVTEQVRRRAQLLLGERESFKKDLSSMYTARSLFIHGSAPLEANGFSWLLPERTSRKIEKTYQAEDIANAVLLASLQKLATNGWNSLEYQENITGKSRDDSSYIEFLVKEISIPIVNTKKLDDWIAKNTKRFVTQKKRNEKC